MDMTDNYPEDARVNNARIGQTSAVAIAAPGRLLTGAGPHRRAPENSGLRRPLRGWLTVSAMP
jgi:hypothetical protein